MTLVLRTKKKGRTFNLFALLISTFGQCTEVRFSSFFSGGFTGKETGKTHLFAVYAPILVWVVVDTLKAQNYYYYLMGALLPQRKSVCSFLFCNSDSMSDILFPQRRGALFSASSSMPQESGASLLPQRRGEARAMRDGFSSSCSYVWPKVIRQQQVKAANSQTIPLLIVTFNE